MAAPAAWRPGRRSDESSLSDRQRPGHYERGIQWPLARMGLPGYQRLVAVEEP
jgi:hypothetical protein